MTYELHEEHENHKGIRKNRTDRAEEVFSIADPVDPYSVDVGQEEYWNRHRGSHVYITRWGFEPRDESHKITEEDVDEECAYPGEKSP